MLFGSDGIFKIPFENYGFAEQICSAALIFIMFYGGFGTRWSEAKPVAARAILLSSLGVILTAVLTGIFCFYILKTTLLEGLLIGAVLSSTDAASVFAILRSKKLNLKYKTASLLEMESGSNDPCSYMLTAILLSVMSGASSSSSILLLVFSQIFFGLFFGAVIPFLATEFLRRFHFPAEGMDTIFVFAVAVFSYAVTSAAGGNGYLAVYIVGIVMGNQYFPNKKNLVGFFDAFTGLMQMLIFFLLGLLAFPLKLPGVFVPGAAIALFLTLVARPAAVGIFLAPFHTNWSQYILVSWAGLRGAASIVFAIMVTVSSTQVANDIFHIVFFVVLFSIILQGSLLPVIARKLDMIDTSSSVLKTFTDYSEETEIQFIQLEIDSGHPWLEKKVKELSLVPHILLAAILREGKTVVPKGDTTLKQGDIVVLGAEGYKDRKHVFLYEVTVDTSHKWLHKKISDIVFQKNTLIVMIRRGNQSLIPSGDTQILNHDILVLFSKKRS